MNAPQHAAANATTAPAPAFDIDAALEEATRLGDRWRARQGHPGTLEHRAAVQDAWCAAVLAGKAVSL